MSWPGFSYNDEEWKRLTQLAEPIGGASFTSFLLLNAVIFIVLAGLAVVGVMLPMLLLIYPDITQIQPLPFTLILATTALLIIGLGLPLSMRLAAMMVGNRASDRTEQRAEQDAALAAKVNRQLLRMTVIMCGLLIPGVLVFIAYDIQGGPWIQAMKWLGLVLMGASMAHTFVRRKA